MTGNLPFKVQVIVTIEIPDERKSWLRCLTSHGRPADLANIVSNTPALEEHNKRYADNVMDIFTKANNDLMKEQLEEPTMCKAVNELFADEIRELKNIATNSKIYSMQKQLTQESYCSRF